MSSLGDLLGLAPRQLEDIDIAEANLLCATGLPGAENLGIGKCLAELDEWARWVKIETGRHLYRAYDPRYARHYRKSESHLRAEMLVQVLQVDCGVLYNMRRVREIDFTNSKDLFIHGMINDANGGTCASMPVLYVAVGRRLTYPLRLVMAKAHVFVRWDSPDGKDRFNIEAAGHGVESYPDEHYRNWPIEMNDADVKTNRYLKSLTPAEELAFFLGCRGHCLLDSGRIAEARAAYAQAHRFAPQDPAYEVWMNDAAASEVSLGLSRSPSALRSRHEPSGGAVVVDVRARHAQALKEYHRRALEVRARSEVPLTSRVMESRQSPAPGQPPR